MTRIVFIEPDGTRHEVDALDGVSVMEAALMHNVRGIVAICGGSCSCSTCHAHVDAWWVDKLEPPDEGELDTLEAAPGHDASSRLTCQIRVEPGLEGLTLRVPPEQA